MGLFPSCTRQSSAYDRHLIVPGPPGPTKHVRVSHGRHGKLRPCKSLRVRPLPDLLPGRPPERVSMAELQRMPRIQIPPQTLVSWGSIWSGTVGSPKRDGTPTSKAVDRFDKKQGMDFGQVFDRAFGTALAKMLGGIPVITPNAKALTPPKPDCVEVGTTRVIGGIRPQNYDVAYRPDGPRVVFDSKTLNDKDSIRKNWQNMINDLASEAVTVHTRFPFCVVAFIVVLPAPALPPRQHRAISSTLERLGSRHDELDQHHLAEAASLVVWDPATGAIHDASSNSPVRLDTMHTRIEHAYVDRYQHLPPHTV